jgi:hypothetical protein
VPSADEVRQVAWALLDYVLEPHAADQRQAAAAPIHTPVVVHAADVVGEAWRAVDPDSLKGLTTAEIAERHPHLPVSVSMLVAVLEFAHAMNERNKERNAKILALEERAQALEQHIKALRLKLDADRAVRS